MLKRVALACVFASLMPALTSNGALAHGPTRQKVTQTIEINAPADKVWAVLGKFDDLSWHPLIGKTEGQGGNKPDATRTLTLKSGGAMDEKLLKHSDADKTYAYEITKVDVKVLPVENYSASFKVSGEGDKSTVEWKTAFYRGYANNDPPPELSDEAAVAAITAMVKAGLDGLKVKVEAGG